VMVWFSSNFRIRSGKIDPDAIYIGGYEGKMLQELALE
jgi:hypothetical protein